MASPALFGMCRGGQSDEALTIPEMLPKTCHFMYVWMRLLVLFQGQASMHLCMRGIKADSVAERSIVQGWDRDLGGDEAGGRSRLGFRVSRSDVGRDSEFGGLRPIWAKLASGSRGSASPPASKLRARPRRRSGEVSGDASSDGWPRRYGSAPHCMDPPGRAPGIAKCGVVWVYVHRRPRQHCWGAGIAWVYLEGLRRDCPASCRWQGDAWALRTLVAAKAQMARLAGSVIGGEADFGGHQAMNCAERV